MRVFACGVELLHFLGKAVFDHIVKKGARVVGIDGFVAEAIDDFALAVHHVVKIEGAFADEVVPALDALLGGLDGFIQPRVLQSFALLHTEALHEFRHALGGAEIAHEVIFKRNEEARETGVTLTRAAATELAINAAGFVPFRPYDMQPAEVLNALASYKGAVVLVTHDEGAVKALEPEKVLLLPDGVEDQWSDALADLISLA